MSINFLCLYAHKQNFIDYVTFKMKKKVPFHVINLMNFI